MQKRIKKLKNKIIFISHPLQHLHSVTISVGFRVGSLFEDETNSGITHLLEHLHFRRLYDLSQEELYFKMQKLGAEIIGKTYNDLLTFEITIVPDFFNEAFDLIFRHYLNTVWSKSEFEGELNLVIKEIENKEKTYREWLDESYFEDTAYSQAIIGDIVTLKNMTLEDIYQWQVKYLVSANSCVVITGNVNNEMLSYAQGRLESLQDNGNSISPCVCLPKNFGHRNLESDCCIVPVDDINSDVTIFCDIDSDLDYETVRLLSSILGEGCGSKLGVELREKFAFTYDINTELISYNGFCRMSVSFMVSNSDFSECMIAAIKTIASTKYFISDTEFDSSFTFFTKNQVMDLDDTVDLNHNYMFSDFILNDKISEPLRRKEKYESITKEDLMICARKLFRSSNLSFLVETAIPEDEIMDVFRKSLSLLV